MGEIRLQKYLAECGVASRRKSEELISEGRVKVNGRTVTEMGARIDPGKDRIEFDGMPVMPSSGHVYIMLNKPAGIMSTCSDENGRESIIDLIPEIEARVFPVGRLDCNSEGLLLLTNDGEITNKLTHPRHRVRKKYIAVTDSPVSESDISRLRSGVDIGGYVTAPGYFKLISSDSGRSEVLCVITEGKNRQIRRMFSSLGHNVVYLKRVAYGDILLGNLKKGKWRYLTEEEIGYLKSL